MKYYECNPLWCLVWYSWGVVNLWSMVTLRFWGCFWKTGCTTNCLVFCICAGGYSCWKCKNVWLVPELCSVTSFSETYTVFLCLNCENVKCDCVKSLSEVKTWNYYFPSHLQDMIDLWIEITSIRVIFQVLIGSSIILITC